MLDGGLQLVLRACEGREERRGEGRDRAWAAGKRGCARAHAQQAGHLAGTAVDQPEYRLVAGLSRALENREVVLVELLAGLVDGVESDQRILEPDRRLAPDRPAVPIDAIDVVSQEILRCIAYLAAGCSGSVADTSHLPACLPHLPE